MVERGWYYRSQEWLVGYLQTKTAELGKGSGQICEDRPCCARWYGSDLRYEREGVHRSLPSSDHGHAVS